MGEPGVSPEAAPLEQQCHDDDGRPRDVGRRRKAQADPKFTGAKDQQKCKSKPALVLRPGPLSALQACRVGCQE